MMCLLTLHNDASYTTLRFSFRQLSTGQLVLLRKTALIHYSSVPNFAVSILQCIPHGKPPCVVLILPISFRAYKGLAPSGKKTPAQSFVLTKNSCVFGFFLLLCSRCALLMQGTHRRFAQWRVSWLIEHSTSYQLLWCIESFVFRNPPHCLLRERQQKPPITCNQTL